MKKVYLTFFALLLFCPVFSQKGALFIFLDAAEYPEFTLTLKKESEEILKSRLEEGELTVNDLDPGDYRFTVSNDDNTVLIADVLEIFENEVTVINLSYYLENFTWEYNSEDSTFHSGYFQQVRLTPFLGLNIDGENKFLNEYGAAYRLGFNFVKEHIGLTTQLGFDYSQTYFSKDSSLVTLENRSWERYNYFNINFSAGARFSISDMTDVHSFGSFFETGITYYLPVAFNYSVQYSDDRYSKKKIHDFTDLRLYGIIGVNSWLAVFAEYRLTDFVKNEYPELPVFRMGLSTLFNY